MRRRYIPKTQCPHCSGERPWFTQAQLRQHLLAVHGITAGPAVGKPEPRGEALQRGLAAMREAAKIRGEGR